MLLESQFESSIVDGIPILLVGRAPHQTLRCLATLLDKGAQAIFRGHGLADADVHRGAWSRQVVPLCVPLRGWGEGFRTQGGANEER